MLDQHRPRLCLLWLPGSRPLCRGGVLHRFTISPLNPQEACRVRRTHVHRRMGQDSLNHLSGLLPLQKCLSVIQAVASLLLFPCSSTLKAATIRLAVLTEKTNSLQPIYVNRKKSFSSVMYLTFHCLTYFVEQFFF